MDTDFLYLALPSSLSASGRVFLFFASIADFFVVGMVVSR